jgi:STE24 endopeptidase
MEQVIVGVFAFFFLEFIVEFGLNELNLRYVRARSAEQKIPDFFEAKMGPEEYAKSVQYTLAKGRFQRWAEIYGRGVMLIVLFGGVLPFTDRLSKDLAGRFLPVPYGDGILFCFIVGLVFSLASLPTDLYATFRLEARFGFNKTTWKVYFADKLKGLVLGILIGGPFLFIILWLMDAAGSLWWIWAFVFIAGFQLLMVVLYPTLIAPLFNKFEPLPEGEFRDRILALAEKVGFRTSGIYSMDGSKRSGHSNAYFTGIGKAKRIVLFDTLIEQMTMDQGMAVLAHEMGHYKMKHIRRMLIVQAVFLFIGLYVLSLVLDYEPLFAAFGLQTPSNHGGLVLFSLLTGPVTFYLGPLMNLLSRKHEYEADRFAVETLHKSTPMEEALVNLTVKNLSNLTPHPWYSAYHYSHPTPTERIGAIRALSMV